MSSNIDNIPLATRFNDIAEMAMSVGWQQDCSLEEFFFRMHANMILFQRCLSTIVSWHLNDFASVPGHNANGHHYHVEATVSKEGNIMVSTKRTKIEESNVVPIRENNPEATD